MTFSTSGTVGSAGVTGPQVLTFKGAENAKLVVGEDFTLGEFVVSRPPGGPMTTYSSTPFSIGFSVGTVDGVAPSPNTIPVTVRGRFDGTQNETPINPYRFYGSLPLVAIVAFPEFANSNQPVSFTPITPTFQAGGSLYKLVVNPDISPEIGSSRLIVRGRIQPVPIPEPTTVVAFGLLAMGLLFQRVRHRRISRM